VFRKPIRIEIFSIFTSPRMHTVSQLFSACRSVSVEEWHLINSSLFSILPKASRMVTASTTLTAPTNPLRHFASIIFQYSFSHPPRGDGPALWRRVLSLHITVNVSESVVKFVYKSNYRVTQRRWIHSSLIFTLLPASHVVNEVNSCSQE